MYKNEYLEFFDNNSWLILFIFLTIALVFAALLDTCSSGSFQCKHLFDAYLTCSSNPGPAGCDHLYNSMIEVCSD